MKLREYQAKQVLRAYGVAVPDGEVATTAAQAGEIAARLGGSVVIKPQLGVKGRGKVGGILFADDASHAERAAVALLGRTIKGERVERLLVEAKADIAHELYAAVTIDHAVQLPVLVASLAGGVEIEQVARETPDKVVKLPVSILRGPSAQDLQAIAAVMGADGAEIMAAMYRIFREHDAETVEVNPLVRTTGGSLMAVDAVLNVDDDARFRHPELDRFSEEIPPDAPIVAEARERAWTYIDLDGDIGILSSGAGLTMAILDLMQQSGGRPANFLDTAQIDDEGIYAAFDLLARAKPVRGLLVNIFAGLNRCDRLASGIVRYVQACPPGVPIVVRMVGNREAQGWQILREAGIEPVAGIEEAIEQITQAVGAQTPAGAGDVR